MVPAFEKSCKAMFEQVDATFQKGMLEHTNVAQQHFDSAHSPLALALRVCMSNHFLLDNFSGKLPFLYTQRGIILGGLE